MHSDWTLNTERDWRTINGRDSSTKTRLLTNTRLQTRNKSMAWDGFETLRGNNTAPNHLQWVGKQSKNKPKQTITRATITTFPTFWLGKDLGRDENPGPDTRLRFTWGRPSPFSASRFDKLRREVGVAPLRPRTSREKPTSPERDGCRDRPVGTFKDHSCRQIWAL